MHVGSQQHGLNYYNKQVDSKWETQNWQINNGLILARDKPRHPLPCNLLQVTVKTDK